MDTSISIGFPDRIRIRPTLAKARVSKTIDFIDRVVGAEGSRYALSNNSLVVPATTQISKILDYPLLGDTACKWIEYPCSIAFKGINYFDGLAKLSRASRVVIPDRYEFDLVGNGNDFWQKCEAVNIRSLDLGTLNVTRNNIKDSWTQSYQAGLNYIFAPILYGKPTGLIEPDNIDPAFHDQDWRPSIYYPAIIAAIEKATGYKIESNFFNLPIFQDSVYLCTVPATDIKKVLPPFCQLNFLRFTNKTFNNGDSLDWDTTNNCPFVSISPGGSSFVATASMKLKLSLNLDGSLLDEIQIRVNGVIVDRFTSPNGFYINDTNTITVSSGDVITLTAVGTAGGINVVFANLLADRIFDPNVIFDTEIELATCLHNHSVKLFLNAISHQFGLIWDINPITRRIQVEPRFNYKIDGQFYQGHYDVTKISPIGLDQTGIKHAAQDYFGRFLKLGYKQEGSYLFTLLESANTSDTPIQGIRFDIDSSRAGGENLNPLFAVLPQFQFRNFSTLPAVLPSDYNQDSEDLPEEWTSEGLPMCGLVYRDNATIFYDEGSGSQNQYDVPWLSQFVDTLNTNANPLDKSYSISYADGAVTGLTSIFYPQYLALISCPETLVGTRKMGALDFQNARFDGLHAIRLGSQQSTWLPISITDFSPTDGIATQTLLKFLPITQAIIGRIKHYP